MKNILTVWLSMIVLGCSYSYAHSFNEPDSIAANLEEEATNLNEVVVEGDNSYLTEEKEVYLPTSRDKKISFDGTALLQNMAISSIYVSPLDKSITTASGEEVSTFIDYLPASKNDLENIKVSNVQKVEVFDYPKDPRFRGAKHVVNYVMVKYEYGGYTRLYAMQHFIFDVGRYGFYSMLTAHRMTYDVSVDYNYVNSKHFYSNYNSEYMFPNRSIQSEKNATASNFKHRILTALFRALYRTDKTVISNIVNVSSNKMPKYYTAYNETFNVDDYVSSISENFTNYNYTTVSWVGNFQFFLPNDFTWITKTTASYGKFDDGNKYIVDNSSVINNTDENAWSADVSTSLSKNFSNNIITFEVTGGAEGNDIEYSGAIPYTVDAMYYHGGVRVNGSFKINKVSINPTVRFYIDRNTFDGVGYTRYNPKYFITASYLLNSKNKFNFSSEMYYISPTISQMGSNLQIQNQIDAITGNPNLKTEIVNSFRLNYQYFPIRNLSFTAYCTYNRNSRLNISSYDPIVFNTQNYMLRNLTNSGFRNSYQYGLAASVRLLNNALSLRVGVDGISAIQHSEATYNITNINFDAQASYSFSNMYVTMAYQSKKTMMYNFGTTVQPQYYNLIFGYVHKKFNFTFAAFSFFNSSYKGMTYNMIAKNRTTVQNSYTSDIHRSFLIGVAYTFSYGKKLGKINEASAPSGVQSGSLK
jgi:hypothetical protein